MLTGRKKKIPHKKRTSAHWLTANDEPIGLFSSKHGLSPSQIQTARALLEKARLERGPVSGWRLALRMAGICSAVKGGRVGNHAWGRRMLGKRGAKALQNNLWAKGTRPSDYFAEIGQRGGEAKARKSYPS